MPFGDLRDQSNRPAPNSEKPWAGLVSTKNSTIGLNAYAERWVKSVKTEALSRVILFGESSLCHVLSEYVKHDHAERCHQGLGNVIPVPSHQSANDREGPIGCRERLGGLLKYYHRQAA